MVWIRADMISDSPAGRGGVQHWERPAGSDSASEDYGVLWEEGETDRTAEENVSVTSSDWNHYCGNSQFPRNLLLKQAFHGVKHIIELFLNLLIVIHFVNIVGFLSTVKCPT